VQLSVVGEAIFPNLGNGTYGDAASMSVETLQALNVEVRISGVLVALTPGTDPVSLRADLDETDQLVIPSRSPLPAEIGDLASAAPIVRTLGWFYAGLAVIALAFGILGASRRRSRELAILRTIGFRPRQLLASSIWLSALLAVVSLPVSLLAGLVGGQALWQATSAELPVLDSSTVPVPALLLMVLGLVAAVVGVGAAATWRPARTAIAARLRAS
jgi:hypothetical protein